MSASATKDSAAQQGAANDRSVTEPSTARPGSGPSPSPSAGLDAAALWQLPRVGAPQPAPDGSWAVVPVTTYAPGAAEGGSRLWRLREGQEPTALTAEGLGASAPAVQPQGHCLAFLRKPGTAKEAAGAARFPDQAQVYLLPLDGGEARRLTDLPLGAAALQWLPDGRHLVLLAGYLAGSADLAAVAETLAAREKEPVKAMVTEDRVYRYWDRWLTDGRLHRPFLLDTQTGELRDLCPGMDRWMGLMEVADSLAVSPDGREIAFNACRSEPPHSPLVFGVYALRLPAPGEAPPAPRLLDPDHTGPASRAVYSPGGRWLVYGIQRQVGFYADRVRLVALDRHSGERRVLTEDWDASADDWVFLDGDRLLIAAEDQARKVLYRLDLARAWEDPVARRPEELLRGGWFGRLAVAGGAVFCGRESLTRPPEVCRLDPATGEVRALSSFCEPLLASLELATVAEQRFSGAEGHTVQMFLLSPADAPPGPLPLVHLVHGGPHGVFGDQWHWRWNPHVFAAAGYRVALVNFHGSTGFGEAFTRSILGQWGEKPAADILAATDLLVSQGLADPDRLALAGGSYGGYLVSWLAGLTDRFKAIVNHAGVSDFQTQLATDVTQGRELSMGGSLWGDLAGLDRFNPIRRAAHFKAPMLVIHGTKDYRVPYNQGLSIYNAYQAQGLPSRLVVYPDENHWILRPHNSRHWYAEVLGWLERWLR